MKIFFYVLDQVGPQNACIGIGQELARRDHQVSFVSHPKFRTKFERYGFGHLALQDPIGCSVFDTENETEIGDTNTAHQKPNENAATMGLFSDRTPLEKLELMQSGPYDQLTDHYARLEPLLKQLLHKEQPDLLIVDGPIIPPVLINSDIPWIKVYCSNPLGLFMTKELPPFLSGLPTDSDRSLWEEFYRKADQYQYSVKRQCQLKLNQMFGYPPPDDLVRFSHSKLLNLYQYPEELDYQDLYRIPDHMQRVDAFCRDESNLLEYQLPDEFVAKMKSGDKLIYLSLGTIGSYDSELMKRLVTVLGKTRHFYIVSCGLNYAKFKLAENMTGAIYLPQTKILPLVDMAIIHGGNNSLTECMSFGKPVLVLPIFYDQFDNAQRVAEKGVGLRLSAYRFTEQELTGAVDQILEDRAMSARLSEISKNIQSRNSKAKACERIEQVVDEFRSMKQLRTKINQAHGPRNDKEWIVNGA